MIVLTGVRYGVHSATERGQLIYLGATYGWLSLIKTRYNMAFIKCPECLREIFDSAHTCPGCGYSMTEYVEKLEAKTINHRFA